MPRDNQKAQDVLKTLDTLLVELDFTVVDARGALEECQAGHPCYYSLGERLAKSLELARAAKILFATFLKQ